MKNKIIGILICMLFLIPTTVITVTAEQSEQLKIISDEYPKICIRELNNHYTGIDFTIENIGDAPAENIRWAVYYSGGIILTGKSHKGYVFDLAPHEEKTIHIGETLGFGKTMVVLTVGIEDSNSYSEHDTDFMLGSKFLNFMI
jgi:hypothetical protein